MELAVTGKDKCQRYANKLHLKVYMIDWLSHLRDEGDSVWQEGHQWLTFQLRNRISIIEFAGLGLHHLLQSIPPLHEPAVTVYIPGW